MIMFLEAAYVQSATKIVDAMVFSPLLLFKFYTFALVKLAYSPSPPPPRIFLYRDTMDL